MRAVRCRVSQRWPRHPARSPAAAGACGTTDATADARRRPALETPLHLSLPDGLTPKQRDLLVESPDWPADVLLPLLERTLDGDPAAVRETFARVETCCAAYDAARGHHPLCQVIDGWGDELLLFAKPERDSSSVRR